MSGEESITMGLPGCFYLDKASQFTTTRHGGIHYSVHTTNKFTQFERAMKELGGWYHFCRLATGAQQR
jgi:hypothetical protein